MKGSGKLHGEACASRRLGGDGPYWHALGFAVLASAAPWAKRHRPRRSEAETQKAPPIVRGLVLSAVDQRPMPPATSINMPAATGQDGFRR
jgi:hypothetical protein